MDVPFCIPISNTNSPVKRSEHSRHTEIEMNLTFILLNLKDAGVKCYILYDSVHRHSGKDKTIDTVNGTAVARVEWGVE